MICQTRGIADCILLGNEEKIRQVAKAQAQLSGIKSRKELEVKIRELVLRDF